MEEIKKQRTIMARKVTRKTNEVYNAIKGQVHISEIQEKIGTLKYCMEDLGITHDNYVSLLDPGDAQLLANEEKWYSNYDEKTNEVVKEARNYMEQNSKKREPVDEKLSHVKLKRLDVPKFDGDPKTFYKWKSIYERYTKHVDEESKYDYLLNSTSGEAHRYVENKTNYTEAMARLDEKYGNIHIIMGILINEIKSLQVIRRGDFRAFEQLSLKVSDFHDRLKLMGKENDAENSYVLKEIEGKLNYEDAQKWLESKGEEVDMRSVGDLMKWLEHQTHLRRITFNNHSNTRSSISGISTGDPRTFRRPGLTSGSTALNSCPNCPAEHRLWECPNFLQLGLNDRWERVKFLRRCFVCLQEGHRRPECTEAVCTVCSRPHHITLHKYVSASNEMLTPVSSSTVSHEIAQIPSISRSLLPVLRVGLHNGREKRNYTAVLDSGSEINIMNSRCCQELGLIGDPIGLKIIGAGGVVKFMKTKRVEVHIADKLGKDTKVECIVLPKACGRAVKPDKKLIESCGLTKFEEKEIYTGGGEIDILIGMSNPELHKQISMERLGNGLVLMETCFGYCLVGTNPTNKVNYECGRYKANHICLVNTHNDEVIWRNHLEAELAGISAVETTKTDEERQFHQRLKISRKESEENRFEVNMAWKYNPETFENNKVQAISCDTKLLKQLNKDRNLKRLFEEQLNEMIELKILKKVNHDFPKRFIPLLAVINLDRESTKVRICLDAKRKFNGVSFNDYLLKGKLEMADIFQFLTEFRSGSDVIQGDIVKMFWQILLSGYDQQFHGIIYNGEAYVFSRICFGDKPSPDIADICMNRIAEYGKAKYPMGSEVVKKKRFVDDLVDAGNETSEMGLKRDEATKLLAEFGFQIKEWLSNKHELGRVKENGKVLGLLWNAVKDVVSVKIKWNDNVAEFTKRTILRSIAEVWDPLGMLVGVLVVGRIIFQAVVRMKLNWDEGIRDKELAEKWRNWLLELKQCERFCIPRSILPEKGDTINMKFKLVGFSDGSSVAYGCTVYIRWYDEQEKSIDVRFIGAKNKINPIRGITIPRAELCGAFLLSRLVHSAEMAIKDTDLKDRFTGKILCTDSTTVLAWIKSASIKYKPFVKNKVIEIQELHPIHIWRYIPSKENISADLVSKGCRYKDLEKIVRGPEFLYYSHEDWPKLPGEERKDEIDFEKCAKVRTNATVVQDDVIEVDRIKSWRKLLRVTGYLYKFMRRDVVTPKDMDEIVPNLKEEEIQKAKEYWIRNAQMNLDPQSKEFQKLSPFRDEKGIIRIYGRLQNMPVFDEDRKHPVLLPKDHKVSLLIVKQAHTDCIHAGHLRIMAEVRKKFWILRLRSLTKFVEVKCIVCRRWRGIALEQRMSNLPSFRLKPSHPFENTAIDYFGPFQMKYGHRSRSKSYGVVFTCLCTRAVHIELATDISTDRFLLALRRFISLYGAPKLVRSDNGSNFVGAAREIREMIKLWKGQDTEDRMKIVNTCNANSIRWTFSTPTASHHNGAVESMIKSIKLSLNKVVKDQVYNEEEFRTIFSEIGAIINSRPLWPASDSDICQQPITCNDLLRPTGLPRDPIEMNVSAHPKKRYQHIQSVVNNWWRIWLLNFAPNLQCRSKWFKDRRNLKVGDIVLIIDPSVQRSRWSMALVDQVYKGNDDLVRSVRVKTKLGSYDRPITKLCLLVSKEELNEAN